MSIVYIWFLKSKWQHIVPFWQTLDKHRDPVHPSPRWHSSCRGKRSVSSSEHSWPARAPCVGNHKQHNHKHFEGQIWCITSSCIVCWDLIRWCFWCKCATTVQLCLCATDVLLHFLLCFGLLKVDTRLTIILYGMLLFFLFNYEHKHEHETSNSMCIGVGHILFMGWGCPGAVRCSLGGLTRPQRWGIGGTLQAQGAGRVTTVNQQ